MSVTRRHLAQRHVAALIFAAALLLRALVPGGYMVASEHGRVTIELCSGVAAPALDMPGMHGDLPGHGKTPDHGKAAMPCAFGSLAAAALGAVDPVQLAALGAYIMAVGLCPALLPGPSRRTHLRPPLRGPPAAP